MRRKSQHPYLSKAPLIIKGHWLRKEAKHSKWYSREAMQVKDELFQSMPRIEIWFKKTTHLLPLKVRTRWESLQRSITYKALNQKTLHLLAITDTYHHVHTLAWQRWFKRMLIVLRSNLKIRDQFKVEIGRRRQLTIIRVRWLYNLAVSTCISCASRSQNSASKVSCLTDQWQEGQTSRWYQCRCTIMHRYRVSLQEMDLNKQKSSICMLIECPQPTMQIRALC